MYHASVFYQRVYGCAYLAEQCRYVECLVFTRNGIEIASVLEADTLVYVIIIYILIGISDVWVFCIIILDNLLSSDSIWQCQAADNAVAVVFMIVPSVVGQCFVA